MFSPTQFWDWSDFNKIEMKYSNVNHLTMKYCQCRYKQEFRRY